MPSAPCFDTFNTGNGVVLAFQATRNRSLPTPAWATLVLGALFCTDESVLTQSSYEPSGVSRFAHRALYSAPRMMSTVRPQAAHVIDRR